MLDIRCTTCMKQINIIQYTIESSQIRLQVYQNKQDIMIEINGVLGLKVAGVCDERQINTMLIGRIRETNL